MAACGHSNCQTNQAVPTFRLPAHPINLKPADASLPNLQAFTRATVNRQLFHNRLYESRSVKTPAWPLQHHFPSTHPFSFDAAAFTNTAVNYKMLHFIAGLTGEIPDACMQQYSIQNRPLH